MQWLPRRTMVRIIEVLRDGPRDRTAIAGALALRESATAAVLTAMQYRRMVLKKGDRYSLPPETTSQDDMISTQIQALIDAAREAHHDDETIADALEAAAAALRVGLT